MLAKGIKRIWKNLEKGRDISMRKQSR